MSMIKTGRAAGGSSGGNGGCDGACHVEVTWEEYAELEEAGAVDPAPAYMITGAPDGGVIPPDAPQTAVAAVEVVPSVCDVQKGGTQIFGAAVTAAGGEGYAPQAVAWAVAGNDSPDTRINGAGVLRVADGETAEGVTVTATSVKDPSKSGSAEVSVTESAPAPGLAGIVLVPSAVEVGRGRAQAFHAYPAAVGGEGRAVSWEVSGGVSSGTYITATGLLRVAADETAAALTVTATALADGSVSASAIAYVADGGGTALDLLLELKEDKAAKGARGGYAPLGADGTVPPAFLPGSDTNFLGRYASAGQLEAAHPSPGDGDYAFAGDMLYVWDGASWEAAGDTEDIPPGTFVERVNGKQGPNVNLNHADVGAAAASHATDMSMHLTAAEKAALAGLPAATMSGFYMNTTKTGGSAAAFPGSLYSFGRAGHMVTLGAALKMQTAAGAGLPAGSYELRPDSSGTPLIPPSYGNMFNVYSGKSGVFLTDEGKRAIVAAEVVSGKMRITVKTFEATSSNDGLRVNFAELAQQ